MKPTDEQAAIINAATTTDENLIITARAGAAKTTTLLQIAEAMPGVAAWFLSFNRGIANEFSGKLPPGCTSATFNRLGYHSWFNHLGTPRQKVDNSKVNNLSRNRISRLVGNDRNEITELWTEEIIRAVRLGKSLGFLPQNTRGDWEPLCTEATFFQALDFTPTSLQKDIICEVSAQSFQQAREGKIDLDDQVFCPAICGIDYDTKPVVFVDEAQDLSPVQHRMLKDIVGNGRLIAVGDPLQAIYEFRGAASDSMEQMQQRFSMREYKLTTSFRCDQAIVRNAQRHAPDMRWRDGADEGLVATLETWGDGHVPDDAIILCRNNAPLFGIFIKLLRAGRNAELTNRVFINDLIKIMEKWQPAIMPQSEVLGAIQEWRRETGERSSNIDFLNDRAECMRLFAMQADNLEGVIKCARNLAQQTGRIKLSTIHRSKGLEFDNVFILDQDLLEQYGQDLNLRYVAETRARHHLTYIASRNYREGAVPSDTTGDAPVPEASETTEAPGPAALPPDQAADQPSGVIGRAVERLLPQRRQRPNGSAQPPPATDDALDPASSRPAAAQPEPETPFFQLNDRVAHPDFGAGYVLNIRKGRTLIDVIFDVTPSLMRSLQASELQPEAASVAAAVPDLAAEETLVPATAAPEVPEPTTIQAVTAQQPSPAGSGFPAGNEFNVGDRVRHLSFGRGTIQSLNKSRCRVLFDNGLPACEVRKSDLDLAS